MDHINILYVLIDQEEGPRLDRDCKPKFELVLVFSDALLPEQRLRIQRDYESNRMPVTATFTISGSTPLEQLKSFTEVVEPRLQTSLLSIWFPGTTGYVSEINDMFMNSKEENWGYVHPALDKTKGLKALPFRYDSYLEYEKEGHVCLYARIAYIPFIAPILNLEVFDIIKKLISVYNFQSMQALAEHWIPEALSRQVVRYVPTLLKCCTISSTHQSIHYDSDYQAARAEAFKVIPSLYPLDEDLDCFCISLDSPDCQWRKDQFQASADRHDVTFEWFSAIDGRKWTMDDFPQWLAHRGRRVDWHEPLTGGEVGVLYSHRTVWQCIWYSKCEGALVFEDDAVLIKNLDALEVPYDTDILFLNDRAKHNSKGEIIEGTCGTDGYLITRRGIYKMLQILEHVNMPLDFMMLSHSESVIEARTAASLLHNPLNPKLRCYHHQVYVTHNDQGQSTIGH